MQRKGPCIKSTTASCRPFLTPSPPRTLNSVTSQAEPPLPPPCNVLCTRSLSTLHGILASSEGTQTRNGALFQQQLKPLLCQKYQRKLAAGTIFVLISNHTFLHCRKHANETLFGCIFGVKNTIGKQANSTICPYFKALFCATESFLRILPLLRHKS